jgi:serine/threonine protein kinase
LEVHNYDNDKNSYVMEYCDLTLHDYIIKNNQTLAFKNRKKIALQFLYGMNYLHRKKYLHRDISFRNILLKLYDYNSVVVKLSDFGLIKEEDSEFTKIDTEMKGTIIDPALDGFKNYSIKNEIYAIGFILQFIFTGKKSLQFKDDVLSKIIIKCTDRDVNKRYNDVSSIIDDVDLPQE